MVASTAVNVRKKLLVFSTAFKTFILLASVGLGLKRGASGFGLDFRVRACVCVCACICNHISDMNGQILFVLGTNTTNDGIHMHIILLRDVIKDGRLVAILVVKNNLMLNTFSTISRTCIYQCCSNLAHRQGMMGYISTSFFFLEI